MHPLQITTPDALPDEPAADAALRPSRLDEFVGQAALKASLQIAIDAARGRGDPLDHILFFGPPGLGKTTLAALLAKEMGVQLRTSSGPVLEKPGDLVGLLTHNISDHGFRYVPTADVNTTFALSISVLVLTLSFAISVKSIRRRLSISRRRAAGTCSSMKWP